MLSEVEDGIYCSITIVIAVDAMHGRHEAIFYMEKQQKIRPVVWNFEAMNKLVLQMREQVPERMYSRIHLQKLKKNELRDI